MKNLIIFCEICEKTMPYSWKKSLKVLYFARFDRLSFIDSFIFQ